MVDDVPHPDDERQVELTSISAIFPELQINEEDPFSAAIELPVSPAFDIPVVFPEHAHGASVATIRLNLEQATPADEVHLLSHLPPVHLMIKLPFGYPVERPPSFRLSTTPQWIPKEKLEALETDGEKLWEEVGHDQVVYAYIDHIQQAAENAFGVLEKGGNLPLGQDLRIGVLDYDIKAKKAAFEKETFDCGVCLDPKKGTACHRMADCGHVFCRSCLQDFYNNAITEGDLASVRCLAPDCAKKRGEVVGNGRRRRPKTNISPSELLQIPLEQEIVKRYVTLKHKAELESDKDTIYCPRKWCQGAARSKKHRKPESLEDAESSDEEEEVEVGSTKGYIAKDELLAICEDCTFAFCRRCFQGWHGEFTVCAPRTNTGELTEEDLASLDYLKKHTTPCPTCAAPAQKTHGCNHMICFRCNTHFCYLCSAWLEPSNPYKHFNVDGTSCFQRLWELEEGDGEGAGEPWFRGGEDPPEANAENGWEEEELEGMILNDGADRLAQARIAAPMNGGVAVDQPQEAAAAERPAFEREAPLVLRIGAVPRPAPVHVPQPAVAAPGGGGRGRGRGGRQLDYNARRDAAIARRVAERQAANQRRNGGLDDVDQRWIQRFVVAALNDEEDLIDDHDHEVWEIGADRGMDRRR